MNLELRLQAISTSQPALASLVEDLLDNGMRPEWYQNYVNHPLPERQRAVLIKAWLGQPYLISNPREQFGSDSAVLRWLDYLSARFPEIITKPFYRWPMARYKIPQSIIKWSGLTRDGPMGFVRDLFLAGKPKIQAVLKKYPHHKRIRKNCYLSYHVLDEWFLGKFSEPNKKAFQWYFNSDYQEAWARNSVCFLSWLVDYGLDNVGVFPGKLSRPLIQRFGLRTESIPDLLALIDQVGLCFLNPELLDTHFTQRDAVASILNEADKDAVLDRYLYRCAHALIMDEEKSNRLLAKMNDNHKGPAKYTALHFNARWALTETHFEAILKPLYDALDNNAYYAERVINQIRLKFTSERFDGIVLHRLAERYSGVELRSILNILGFLSIAEEHEGAKGLRPSQLLPTSALRFLGYSYMPGPKVRKSKAASQHPKRIRKKQRSAVTEVEETLKQITETLGV